MRALLARPLSLPPLLPVHEPVAVTSAILEAEGLGLCSPRASPSPPSHPLLHTLSGPLPRSRTQTNRVHNLISIGLDLGDRQATRAPRRRARLLREREVPAGVRPGLGAGRSWGTVLALGQDWGRPGSGGRGRKAPPSAQLPWSPEQMATLSPGVRAATFNTFKRLRSACRGSLADIQNRLKTRDGARRSGEL